MGTKKIVPSVVAPEALFRRWRWIDGQPLWPTIEPYRRRLFDQFFVERDELGRPRYNLGLFSRSKKNWKSADLSLACLYALLTPSSAVSNQVYLVANDKDQAGDDLELIKLILRSNPELDQLVRVKANLVERCDGSGFIEVLPAQDVAGAHGKTYRLLACDEIHGWRNWDLLEALTPDPTRLDAQIWITTYATVFHRPGVPLFDLYKRGREGVDARMLFSWYAADFTTDPAFEDKAPADRANPSRASWGNDEYLDQQQRRLPSYKFRRLHLNLPGLPEGSAFQPDPVMDAVDRGVKSRPYVDGCTYTAAVDMSGGSADDAVLAIAHVDDQRRAVLDRMLNQGPQPPFDPRKAVERFVGVLREYRIARVTGDAYAGQTFRADFEAHGIRYVVSDRSTSQFYEALEPLLNGARIVLLDEPTLEQQLLGLVWRGGRIDHQSGEHDDWSNAAALVLVPLAEGMQTPAILEYIRQEKAL